MGLELGAWRWASSSPAPIEATLSYHTLIMKGCLLLLPLDTFPHTPNPPAESGIKSP